MKIITDYKKVNIETPKILDSYFGDMKIGAFDIETLGLNPEYTELILSGFTEFEPDGTIKATQYFAENPMEEYEVLEKTIEHLNTFDLVFTYNGKHFDMPFVNKRASKLGISSYKPCLYNFDIYLLINGHSPFKKLLPNLKQKTVEEFFGLGQDRTDEISGKESIDFYYTYVSCQDTVLKADMMRQILLHNHDDIIQLTSLIPIVRKCDIHKGMNKLGFVVKGKEDFSSGISWENFTIDSIKMNSKEFEVSGKYPGKAFSYHGFSTWDHPYLSEFKKDGTYIVKYPVESLKGNTYIDLSEAALDASGFIKYSNYVNGYLILKEHEEIHYLEVNMLAKAMVEKLMTDTVWEE